MRRTFKKALNIFMVIAFQIIFLSGCQHIKLIQIPLNPEYSLQINEKAATNNQRANFYLCNSESYSCNAVTNKWSGKKPKNNLAPRKNKKIISKIRFKKPLERIDENVATKKYCNPK